MSKKPFEEHHLIGLLRNFDTDLALSYLQKVRSATQMIKDKGLSGALNLIEDGVFIDPFSFRIALREPAFVLLSHPICRLRTKVPYPKQIEWERFFVAHLGMVPIYLVNLNVITVLKLWGEDSSLVVSKSFEEELDKGGMLLELSPSSQPAEYSSMNFVLLYRSSMHKGPDGLLEPFQKYYRHLFWAHPGEGYTFSSHFLHRRAKITSFIKVTKSLYTVSSVGNPRQILVEGRPINCRELNLVGFSITDGKVHDVRGNRACVPIDVVVDLEHKDVKKCFLNAMLIELRSELGKVNLLSNIVDIGESSFDLIVTLFGMQVSQQYHESDRPCYVCTIEELCRNNQYLLGQLSKHISLPITISDMVNNLELAFHSLYPFLVADGNSVLFTHPMIMGFLARQRKLDLLNSTNRKSLINLLNLLESIHDTKRNMEIYLDPRMDEFRGENKKEAMYELFSIERRIRLYKCLYQSFCSS